MADIHSVYDHDTDHARYTDCYFISRIPLLICPISSDSVELTMKRVVIFAIFPRRLLVTVSTSCIGLCQLHSPLKV